MSKILETRYAGPGDVIGSRMHARDVTDGNRVWEHYSHELGDSATDDEHHRSVLTKFLGKWQWGGSWVSGNTKGGRLVWVDTSLKPYVTEDGLNHVNLNDVALDDIKELDAADFLAADRACEWMQYRGVLLGLQALARTYRNHGRGETTKNARGELFNKPKS